MQKDLAITNTLKYNGTGASVDLSTYELWRISNGGSWPEATASLSGTLADGDVYIIHNSSAHGGDNYYRLTQVDIDGTSKTYDVINVSCSQTTSGYFSIFSNPSSGSFQVMLNNSDIVGQAEMNIVDTKGNRVFKKSIDVKKGVNLYTIHHNLKPGIYYLKIDKGVFSRELIKFTVL